MPPLTLRSPHRDRIRQLVVVVAAALLLAGCLSPAAKPIAPGGPLDQAHDVAAKALLQRAVTAANVHLAESGSWQGFDAAAGARFDPLIRWQMGGEPPVEAVSILPASATDVQLVTRSRSGSFFCAHGAAATGAFGYGAGEAFAQVDTPAECAEPLL